MFDKEAVSTPDEVQPDVVQTGEDVLPVKAGRSRRLSRSALLMVCAMLMTMSVAFAEDGTSTSLSGVLGDITSIVSSAAGWVGSFVTVITSHPLLLVGVVIPFVGFGVGLLKRLLHV